MRKTSAQPRRSGLRRRDLDQSKAAVLNSLGSPASRRAYGFAIDEFIAWYCSEPRLSFGRIVVTRFRMSLEARGLGASSINQRLAAVRRLAYEAADCGLLSPDLAAGVRRVKGARQLGHRAGNWLTLEQCSTVLNGITGQDLRAKRDRAMIAVLMGCGLRRAELAALEVDHIQTRQGHWAIIDLVGKGGHVRTVPIPSWAKDALDRWTSAAGITGGRVFRAVSRAGTVWGSGISENVVWHVVSKRCNQGDLEHVAPHDLRRTCARLCHSSGGELEQIQFLLGHSSVQTTERYLGCKQNLGNPVNDRFVPAVKVAPEPAKRDPKSAEANDRQPLRNASCRTASRLRPTSVITFDEFHTSLSGAQPPDGLTDALRSLWWDAKGDWNQAHESAQQDEGRDGSWVHAYLHRKEGDQGNAAYWYGRADKPASREPLDREWVSIATALLARL